MASEGGLIALTFILLIALLLLLYCLLRQMGSTKQTLRRLIAFLCGGAAFSPRKMASSGVSPLGQHEDEENDSMETGGRAAGGLFWRKLEEERSILGDRRVPTAVVTTPADYAGGQNGMSEFGTLNSYHGGDYTYAQQGKMATTLAHNAEVPCPLPNGVSSVKKNSYQDAPAASSPLVRPHSPHPTPTRGPPPSTRVDMPVDSRGYSYNIETTPLKNTTTAAATPSTGASPSPQLGPGRNRPSKELKGKKPTGKSPVTDPSTPKTTGFSTHRAPAVTECSRPATPDFRYTILADEEEAANGATSAGSSTVIGNPFRSASMDGAPSGQLTADKAVDEARRHSLTSTPVGMVSPALSIDNPSPTGSISDVDQESILILEESISGGCSRRTSISSMDSNMERLEDSGRPRLLRAQSTDSLESTTSIMELSMNDTEIGQLETRLYYDSSNQYLHIWILQAYDVKPPPLTGGATVEYWVVVFLLPHQKPLYRTQLQTYSPVLQFHEQFRQRVREQDVRKLALLCQLYCRMRPSNEGQSITNVLAAATATSPLSSSIASKRRGSSDLIAQAKVRLKDVEVGVANTLWLPLLPRLDNSSGDYHLGEILFSLSYLPTAERLTVVVAKIRNIRNAEGVMPEKVLVRVYLVYGAKISKKKTSTKVAVEGSAIFNESMIFSLSQNLVQKVYLRLSVIESLQAKNTGSDQRTIGHITVGSRRPSKEFGHWQKMIEQPRKPVSMWHHLSPKNQKSM